MECIIEKCYIIVRLCSMIDWCPSPPWTLYMLHIAQRCAPEIDSAFFGHRRRLFSLVSEAFQRHQLATSAAGIVIRPIFS